MSVDYASEIIEYTKIIDPDSSLVDGIYFDENENSVVLDLDNDLYLYEGVSAEDVAALAAGDNGSVGAYYNKVFKHKFGPSEPIGSYLEWDFELVPVNKDAAGTPKGLTYPTPSAATVSSVAVDVPTKEYSLQTVRGENERTSVLVGGETKEYSLAEIAKPGVTTSDGVSTTVEFTLDGVSEKVYTYEANTDDVYDAVEELHAYVSRMGATGKVKRVVVDFE